MQKTQYEHYLNLFPKLQAPASSPSPYEPLSKNSRPRHPRRRRANLSQKNKGAGGLPGDVLLPDPIDPDGVTRAEDAEIAALDGLVEQRTLLFIPIQNTINRRSESITRWYTLIELQSCTE